MSNTTAGTMIKGAPAPIRRVLTVAERESLKSAAFVYGVGQTEGENFSNGAQGASPVNVPWLRVNRVRLNEQQQQVMRVLKEQSPEPTNPEERDSLKKRLKQIEEMQERSGLRQTAQELRAHSHRDPVFMSALEKPRKYGKPMDEFGGKTYDELEFERRNICRRLDPDNPEADSEEKLRKLK